MLPIPRIAPSPAAAAVGQLSGAVRVPSAGLTVCCRAAGKGKEKEVLNGVMFQPFEELKGSSPSCRRPRTSRSPGTSSSTTARPPSTSRSMWSTMPRTRITPSSPTSTATTLLSRALPSSSRNQAMRRGDTRRSSWSTRTNVEGG